MQKPKVVIFVNCVYSDSTHYCSWCRLSKLNRIVLVRERDSGCDRAQNVAAGERCVLVAATAEGSAGSEEGQTTYRVLGETIKARRCTGELFSTNTLATRVVPLS